MLFYNKLIIDKQYETVIEVFQKRFIPSNENQQSDAAYIPWSLIFEALLRIVS